MATRWGVLWGPAAGLWLLAPALLTAQHATACDASHWWHLFLALLVLFVAIAVGCSVIAGFPLMILEKNRGSFADPDWAYGLGIGVLLAPAYIALTSYVIWLPFGASAGTDSARLQVQAFVVPSMSLLLLSLFVYRRVRAAPRRPSAGWLLAALVTAIVVGGATLPSRTMLPCPDSSADADPLVPLTERAPPAPLLFVGIDAAHWGSLRPLMHAGELPVLSELVAAGRWGTMHALWPPYWSGPAWAAIVTGHPREDTGIYEDLALEVPGLPMYQIPVGLDPLLAPLTFLQYALVRVGVLDLAPPARTMLRQAPFWELLTRAGTTTAVVRFPFTYPANGGADVMISDAVGRDAWSLVGVSADREHAMVFPPTLAASLASTFAGADPRPDDLAEYLSDPSRPRPANAFFDPIPMLRLASRIDRETFEASETLVRTQPHLGMLAVYLGGFDTICHAFWHYRFPDPSSPWAAAPSDVADLAPVLDRYLRFLDEGLGRLIRAFPRTPNVIIVSDHGYEADPGTVFQGRHGPEGIFVAAGPAIAPRTEGVDVSYYDVVPTIVDVLRFAKPAAIRGVSRASGGD